MYFCAANIKEKTMAKYENEVIEYLGIPSLPKKEWDKKSSFARGVAIVELVNGGEACAVCSFSPESGDTNPHITKVFGIVPFKGIKSIHAVPDYMAKEEDVAMMDLDEASKEKAARIIREANEIENGDVEDDAMATLKELPEWIFPHISNREEAEAFVREYKRTNRIKGSIPKSDENLKSYLYVIYSETQKKLK